MKIGIFGGSFNPVHNAHIEIIKYILDNLNLDKIIIIPVGIPSHKDNNLALENLRLAMCELAFDKFPKVEVSDIEIRDNKVSYTIDTLKKIQNIYGKENEYFEIVGDDCIENFHKWKDYKNILKLSKLIVYKRGVFHKKDKNIIYLDNDICQISSTEIRDKITKGESINNFLPPQVLKIIQDNNLYKK